VDRRELPPPPPLQLLLLLLLLLMPPLNVRELDWGRFAVENCPPPSPLLPRPAIENTLKVPFQ
jgi:hypothetical protein